MPTVLQKIYKVETISAHHGHVTDSTRYFAQQELAEAYMKKLMKEEAEEYGDGDFEEDSEGTELIQPSNEVNNNYWTQRMGSYNSSVLDAQKSHKTQILLIEVNVYGTV